MAGTAAVRGCHLVAVCPHPLGEVTTPDHITTGYPPKAHIMHNSLCAQRRLTFDSKSGDGCQHSAKGGR